MFFTSFRGSLFVKGNMTAKEFIGEIEKLSLINRY